ncbi:MAG: phosphomannomutase/phosphoglucomutase [Candidatus Latescibacterota bacterium]|nr:phosphomannomutase/phosphoglucomutase [Candidatus Latescibacterota bacterium]
MNVDNSIFKAYDIRGVYPDSLDEKVAFSVGRAFVELLEVEEVVVGRDMRLSSPPIKDHLVRGLTYQGADVIDIGMVSTDQYYYACASLKLPGVMVTASHNPPEYSGFKMVRDMPYLLSGDSGIDDLRKIIENDHYSNPKPVGCVCEQDVSLGFIDKVLSIVNVDSISPLHVIVDTGNGMVGPILQRVFHKLAIQTTGLYLDPDGNLPNHGLDPMQPENREELQKRVLEEKAEIGFAFDGDGDRFFVIDDRGEFIPGDFITALIGCYMLERYPRAKIVYDVRCSWAIRDSVQAAGGTALIERVGHSFIKPRMYEEGAVYAGELSGHHYFKDFFGADSGLVPALILLEMLSKQGRNLSELIQPLENRYFLSSEINTEVESPQDVIDGLARRYVDAKIEYIDGISINYENWHFNVRASNTEPLLRLNLEALDERTMHEKRDEVLTFIRS